MKRSCAFVVFVLLFASMAFALSESYDWGCPMYGRPTIDLSPISNFLESAKEVDIYIPLKEIGVSIRKEDEWINFEVGDSFWFLYDYYYDGSKEIFLLEVPVSYRPKDEIMPLFISSVLSMDKGEAERLFSTIQYNVINDGSIIEKDNMRFEYTENRFFHALIIRKYSISEGE